MRLLVLIVRLGRVNVTRWRRGFLIWWKRNIYLNSFRSIYRCFDDFCNVELNAGGLNYSGICYLSFILIMQGLENGGNPQTRRENCSFSLIYSLIDCFGIPNFSGTSDSFLSYQDLAQWFPTGVPWRGVRGAAKYWIYYLFSFFTTKGAPNCHLAR